MTPFEAQARKIMFDLISSSYLYDGKDVSPLGHPESPPVGEAIKRLTQLHESEMRNQTDKVTRFEVIDHSEGGTGRDFVKYGVRVELSLQDDDRTLKVFLTSQSKEDVA